MRPAGSTEFGAVLHEMLAGADVPAAARRWADGDLVPGLAVWRRLAGLGVTHRSVDPARSLSEVHAHRPLSRNAADAAARALDFGALACSAQLLGAGRALLETSVRHARLRVQFGRPIGTVQAVKHRLADVTIGLEFARPLLDAAAEALADGTALADGAVTSAAARDVSAAKVACADAAYLAARAALQVHGAIGYTAEADLSLWLAKVRALVSAWGSQAEHRARVMAELGTTDGRW
jgi:alkylation response protein AidB-like acyl-CoA dehydrogenase